jgi:hypothetical protein
LYRFDKKILHSSIGLRPRLGYNNPGHTSRRTDLTLTMAQSLKTSRDIQAAPFTGPFTPEKGAMAQTNVPSIDVVICHEVTSLVSCTLDELAQRVPAYSWAQVFAAVDRLSRQGTLTLSRTRCFGYVVSIGPAPPTPQSSQDRKCQALFGRLS